MIDKILTTLLASISTFICLFTADNLSKYFEYADEIGLAILLGALLVRVKYLEEKLKKEIIHERN